VPRWDAEIEDSASGLAAERETGLMCAYTLREFQVEKALTSFEGPSSWMRRRRPLPGPRGVRRLRLRPTSRRQDKVTTRQRLPLQPKHSSEVDGVKCPNLRHEAFAIATLRDDGSAAIVLWFFVPSEAFSVSVSILSQFPYDWLRSIGKLETRALHWRYDQWFMK